MHFEDSRSTISAAVVLLALVTATPATMRAQSSPTRLGPGQHPDSAVDSPENSLAQNDEPEAASTEPAPSTARAIDFCDGYMAAYLESSARKLYRALSANDFELDSVGLPGWVQFQAARNGSTISVQFDVLSEKEGDVVGLVGADRTFRRTFVVAETQFGPVVVAQIWPARSSLEAKEDCRPTTTRVEYPPIEEAEVDVEPFKYWGLRVAKRLPHDAANRLASDEEKGPTNTYELLKSLVGPETSRDDSEDPDPREQVDRALDGFEID